jgi:hypothetical protein
MGRQREARLGVIGLRVAGHRHAEVVGGGLEVGGAAARLRQIARVVMGGGQPTHTYTQENSHERATADHLT